MKRPGTTQSRKSAAAAVLAWALSLGGTGLAEAEVVHTLPLDRSESIHEYTDQFQTVLAIQDNDALQVVVLDSGDPPYPTLEVRRAFLEFRIPDFSGMTTSTLYLQKYYDAGLTTPTLFDVSVYVPELDITLQTFHIPTTPLNEFTTNFEVQVETLAIDISPAVSQFAGQALGLRIKLSNEGTLGEDDFRGAGFEDDFNGVSPWIEVLELSPAEAVESLLALIRELVDDRNLARSLTKPLESAVQIVSDGNARNDEAAVNMLEALINKVEAQRGKKISAGAADALIEEAVSLQLFLQR